MDTYLVQIGRNKGVYKTRWSFNNETQAMMYYISVNVFNGYKKRLVKNGTVVLRTLS